MCPWLRRVFQAPIEVPNRASKSRAFLSDPVADGDDVLEGLSKIPSRVLRVLPGDINPDFLHNLQRNGVQSRGVPRRARPWEGGDAPTFVRKVVKAAFLACPPDYALLRREHRSRLQPEPYYASL